MAIRMPRFLRRLVRRNMSPMHENEAWSWKQKISIVYAVVAWNAAGFVLYQIFKGNMHWPSNLGITKPEDDLIPPSVYYANLLGIKKAQVVTVSGMNVARKQVDFTNPNEVETVTTEVKQET